MHRLLEGQGRKEGHFSACFGSQEGTLAHVLAPERIVYHVLTSQGGSLVFCRPRGHFGTLFWLPRGHFSASFGSQEGTLVRVLAPKRAL